MPSCPITVELYGVHPVPGKLFKPLNNHMLAVYDAMRERVRQPRRLPIPARAADSHGSPVYTNGVINAHVTSAPLATSAGVSSHFKVVPPSTCHSKFVSVCTSCCDSRLGTGEDQSHRVTLDTNPVQYVSYAQSFTSIVAMIHRSTSHYSTPCQQIWPGQL